MGKRETRKREILEQAFSTWSKEHFVHTSLESVAKAMGMTKPAIYRYFSGKEALLEAMREHFTSIFDEICMSSYRKNGSGRFIDAFEAYNEVYMRFFAENPEYFIYAMVMYIPGAIKEGAQRSHVEEMYRLLFPDSLFENELGWSEEDAETVRNYIVTTGGFLLSHLALLSNQKIVVSAEDLLLLNRRFVLEGLGNGEKLRQPDFAALEEACIVSKEDLLEPDHIFSAIAEVVAEWGLWEASLEKIAKKAGMTKSSLYFYFENRNDMLWKMIDRERQHVGELFLSRTEGMEKPEELLYAYFLLFGGYLSHRPDFLSVMNWFRVQRINFQPPNHAGRGMMRYLEYLRRGIEEGRFHTYGLGEFELIRFLHFIVVNEINKAYWSGLSIEKRREKFRLLYTLFIYGVEGV